MDRSVSRRRPAIPAGIRECNQDVNDAGRDWVYAYWDRGEVLLYVGLSNNAFARANTHRSQSKWWRFVTAGTAWQVNLRESDEIEQDLIRDLRPMFNTQHAYGDWRTRVEYCARRDAWDLVDHIIDDFHTSD